MAAIGRIRNHIVPAWAWANCQLPSLGHDFWLVGDLQIRPPPLPDGSVVHIGGQTISLPLGGLLPITSIRGLRVARDGVLAICRSLKASTRIGRRKGVGDFAKDDEPLVREMHKLLADGAAASVHAAAVKLAPRAKGLSEEASKVRRLMDRYRSTFGDSH